MYTIKKHQIESTNTTKELKKLYIEILKANNIKRKDKDKLTTEYIKKLYILKAGE